MAAPPVTTPPLTVDQLCALHGLIKPSRRAVELHSTPRVGRYYWVDFPHDAYAPEFVGEHPGIVIRAAQTLQETCVIVPVSSTHQQAARHVHKLLQNPNPNTPNRDAWVICNHIYTVNLARLRAVKDARQRPIFPKVSKEDMEAIYACIRSAFPQIFSLPDKNDWAPEGVTSPDLIAQSID